MSSDEPCKGLPVFDATAESWASFYLKIKLYLESRDLLYIILREEDSIKPDGETDSARSQREKEALTRSRDDIRVRSLLVNKMSDDALKMVGNEPSAYKMIEVLRSHFMSQSAASVLLRLVHVANINSAIQNLKDCGPLDWDKLHQVMLLRSMPKTGEWSQIVTALKTQEDSLTKEKIIRSFMEIEMDMKHNLASENGRNKLKNVSFQSEQNGNNFPNSSGNQKRIIKCFKCGKEGHIMKFCKSKVQKAGNYAKKKENLSLHFQQMVQIKQIFGSKIVGQQVTIVRIEVFL
ncbi:hypothetical protein HDU83_005258 [Entophlyctis luteolus]|nr:hypothetical protein HDU83_005258 [Entophlyctis luteolus]